MVNFNETPKIKALVLFGNKFNQLFDSPSVMYKSIESVYVIWSVRDNKAIF